MDIPTILLRIVANHLLPAIKLQVTAGVVTFTTNLVIIQQDGVYRNKFLSQEDAAVLCQSTMKFRDAVWYLSTIQLHAADQDVNTTVYKIAEHAQERFANHNAVMCHATTGNANANLAIILAAVIKNSLITGIFKIPVSNLSFGFKVLIFKVISRISGPTATLLAHHSAFGYDFALVSPNLHRNAL